ncbi:YdeI/OmpD-associated family protein [Brachybacterium aquaticum]|uniref:DUF1905 domain-containing protein n=1 Tax=Brachybacterium aquaticum TaxID=1432564 RepID=A0A841AGC5_9MICO|nr:YdeI/OmpD-associated family protein [Brachybacterium aquaticum]MBB5832385.1 hypothetical protein [Brachybacterium aquaticum]
MAARSTDPVSGTGRVRAIDDRLIIALAEDVSAGLPSRGQVAADAVIGGHELQVVVEPDGRKGHWLDVDEELRTALALEDGDTVELTLTPAAEWPEPEVPDDLRAALTAAEEQVGEQWEAITPMARWEWVRWVGATRSAQTRAKRVDVSVDKLRKGSRRPCCFDLSSCTDPELARSGKLRE